MNYFHHFLLWINSSFSNIILFWFKLNWIMWQMKRKLIEFIRMHSTFEMKSSNIFLMIQTCCCIKWILCHFSFSAHIFIGHLTKRIPLHSAQMNAVLFILYCEFFFHYWFGFLCFRFSRSWFIGMRCASYVRIKLSIFLLHVSLVMLLVNAMWMAFCWPF